MTTSAITRRSTLGVVAVLALLLSITAINRANATSTKVTQPASVAGGIANAGLGPQGPSAPKHAAAQVAPAAAAPTGYPVTGIDVSVWQGTVNWTTVAKTAKFAYVKATEGTTYISQPFATQYAGAKAAGLYTGAYAFGRPESPALAQADFFLNHAQFKHDGKTMPPMLDLEWPYTLNGSYVAPYPCYGLTPAAMVAWIRTFVNEVKLRTGSPTLLYTAANWWNTCTAGSNAFNDELLDVAAYAATPPTTLPIGWSTWTIWQYAASGTLPGDQNVFNGSLTTFAAFASRPGCHQAPAVTAKILPSAGCLATPKPRKSQPSSSR